MANSINDGLVATILRVALPSAVALRLALPLTGKGANPRTLCLFHNDSDPSLTLFDATDGRGGRPHFHCFVCGAHGDVFNLVQQAKNSTFPDAVEWLASAFGLQNYSSTNKNGKSDKRLSRGAGISSDGFSLALQIYRSRNGTEAIENWLASRQLSRSLIEKAELALARPNTLAGQLSAEKISPSRARIAAGVLEDVGLVRPIKGDSASGEMYLDLVPRVRDFYFDARVLFPIRDMGSKLVGFAGRLLESGESSAPKYLYTPKLPRRDLLYRGDVVRRNLLGPKDSRTHNLDAENLYICEGFADALRLESLGLNAVALMGAQASEPQVNLIQKFADDLHSEGRTLVCRIFFDRDEAGARGAAKLSLALAKRRIEATYTWPIIKHLDEIRVSPADRKDPDSILKTATTTDLEALVGSWQHPSALAVVASVLKVLPEDILEKWNDFSVSRRFRSAYMLGKDPTEIRFLLDLGSVPPENRMQSWLTEVLMFRSSTGRKSSDVSAARQDTFIEDENARLNRARALARSGAERGELATDEAAWRRLDLGATAFNLGFEERFRENVYAPIEPFDAVLVSRDFGKTSPRLKAMPCPEDLIVQQYLLGEILTERFDLAEGVSFSDLIPAVRFYRELGITETTAESGNGNRDTETLSFAYQIDVEVLEGQSTPAHQGMFRPYIECWREFIASLRAKSERFEQVYAVRLDLRRYYDRLSRSTIRDVLRQPFTHAMEALEGVGVLHEFAPYLISRQNLGDKLIDWLCDQSFGFEYYNPESGEIETSEDSIGIPQGPVLSAWLATVALFPLDAALRKAIKEIEGAESEFQRAGYARYVDDIFLIASSPDILQKLRAVAEEAAKTLRLELVQKGDSIPKMSAAEFREFLSEGKAFVGSGPVQEVGLLHLGDGEAGYETRHDADLSRSSALMILSDRGLYLADEDLLLDKLYTAIQAPDLRPNELPKIARWIWYSIASKTFDSPEDAWRKYWVTWNRLTRNVKWKLSPSRQPWEDPAFPALDGLERILASANVHDRSLLPEEDVVRQERLIRLAQLPLQDEFLDGFLHGSDERPLGAGVGVARLRRMFIQRCVGLRWVAAQLSGQMAVPPLPTSFSTVRGERAGSLNGSLVRANLSEYEVTGCPIVASADQGESRGNKNALRRGFIWLHAAIIALGRREESSDEPLSFLSSELRMNILEFAKDQLPSLGANQSRTEGHLPDFFLLLDAWLANDGSTYAISNDVRRAALSSILAVCHSSNALKCLGSRGKLLNDAAGTRLLPALPGLNVDYLLQITEEYLGQHERDWPRLTDLHAISFAQSSGSRAAVPVPKVANSAGVAEVILNWDDKLLGSLTLAQGQLRRKSALWSQLANRVTASAPAQPIEFESKHLKWAAALFEFMAAINHGTYEIDRSGHSAHEDPCELVVAWPFVALSAPLNSALPENLELALLGPMVPRKVLGSSAFARDAQGRLKSHEVPIADAWLWRIGYAVTDMLGLTDELDKYRKIDTPLPNQELRPAEFILKAVLRRLRGDFAPASNLSRHSKFPHLPATTVRALELLRNYPENVDTRTGILYALAVEVESRAMGARLSGVWRLDLPGEGAAFLKWLAMAVVSRLPAKWTAAFGTESSLVSVEPRLRRSVAAWLAILSRLEAVQLEKQLENDALIKVGRGLTTLLAGVKLNAITAWLRALGLEIETAGIYPLPKSLEWPVEWGPSDASLLAGGRSDGLLEIFSGRGLRLDRGAGHLDEITPVGWLLLVTARLDLYSETEVGIWGSNEAQLKVRERATELANLLAATPLDAIDPTGWPFELTAPLEGRMLDGDSFESAIILLRAIDRALHFEVRTVRSDVWGLRPRSQHFTDAAGKSWRLAKWLVEQVPAEQRLEEIGESARGPRQYVWTETRDRQGVLNGVSVLGFSFARFAAISAIETGLTEYEKLGTRSLGLGSRSSEPVVEEPAEGSTHSTPLISDTTIASGTAEPNSSLDIGKESESGTVEVVEEIPSATKSVADRMTFVAHTKREWERRQSEEWRQRRSAKAGNHVRIALMQFSTSDSYFHPLREVMSPEALEWFDIRMSSLGREKGFADWLAPRERALFAIAGKARMGRGTEHLWTASALLPSFSEYRRRQLLEKALQACTDFRVEVLVLPEYSVRPDTVAWLRSHLELTKSSVSVVAGTYRLHGDRSQVHFTETYKDIFGLADDALVLKSTLSEPDKKGAYITLLHPIEVSAIGHVVTVFSRKKKYPSVAMREIFNPLTEKWAPLLTIDKLVLSVEHHLRQRGARPLSVMEATQIARQFPAVERMAELICSELFITTHPANWQSVLDEFHKLRTRFGQSFDPQSSSVNEDVGEFSNYLGMVGSSSKDGKTSDRRTICIVPAYTSRSADYWIYGQSALLAAGITTVFCAAVSEVSKGGSCFIGKSSWDEEKRRWER